MIEILIFLLVVFALVMVLLASAGTLHKTRSTNLTGIATKIASCEIEGFRNTEFAFLPANGTATVSVACSNDLSKLPSGTATRTIATYGGDTEIKQITVNVNWTESAVAQNIQLITLKTRYGI